MLSFFQAYWGITDKYKLYTLRLYNVIFYGVQCDDLIYIFILQNDYHKLISTSALIVSIFSCVW